MNSQHVITQTGGADLEAIVSPGHNLLVCRRNDGTWRLSYGCANVRKRRKFLPAEGPDFATALNNLAAQIGADDRRQQRALFYAKVYEDAIDPL